MAVQEILLSVRDLKIEGRSDETWNQIINGCSFDLRKGEVLGMIGESGAGKSMTGSAIIGLIEPPGHIAGGTIHLGDDRIDNLSADEMRKVRGRRIGMVYRCQNSLSSRKFHHQSTNGKKNI